MINFNNEYNRISINLQLYIKENFKFFAFIYIIYLIGYAALLRADSFYIDDMRRVLDGVAGWENFSRFSSNFLSGIFNTNKLLTDLSPLSQLVSIVFLSLSSVIMVKIFNDKLGYLPLLASAFIGLNPYYLENMSYKYDSIYMAIAVFSTIFPFIFTKRTNFFVVTSVLSLLLMYTTYQTANSIFIIASLLYAGKLSIENNTLKRSIYFLLTAGSSFLLATLVYKFFILNEVSAYVSSEMHPISSLFSGIKNNLIIYFNDIKNNFRKTTLSYLVILAYSLYLLNIYIHTKSIKKMTINLIVSVIALLVSYGLYLVLVKPLWAARAFTGIGAFIAIIGILAIKYQPNYLKPISFIIFSSLTFSLFVISTTYGNALKAQDEFNDFRINLLLSDLNSELDYNVNYNIYIESGKINAPRIEKATKAFPILNKLIMLRLQKDWVWTGSVIYKSKTKMNFILKPCINQDNKKLKETDTIHHKISMYDNNCIIVRYK